MKVKEFINYTVKNHYTKTSIHECKKKRLYSGEDVYKYCKDMQKLPKEYLRGLYLNVKNEIIHDEIISIGTIDQSICHPRDILRPAILHNAAAFILVHNHPSGDTTPSQADINITNKIKKISYILSITLLDHVIIGDGYKSCK